MKRSASLLSATLLLAGSPAWAAGGDPADLRYCLDLKSNYEIAKCAGEISPGQKGKPLPRKEVERILEKERMNAPVSPETSSGVPAAPVSQPGKDLPPAQTETN